MTSSSSEHEVLQVFVGDTGPPLEFEFYEQDGITKTDLSGCAAWVTFNYIGEDPHVVRPASITSAADGAVRYALKGDEYSKVGRLCVQASYMRVDFAGVPGLGWNTYSSDVVRRKVIARPA